MRLGRKISENYSNMGEYLAHAMTEFEAAKLCSIWHSGGSRLEHRMSVAFDGQGYVLDESRAPAIDSRLLSAADRVFRSKTPTVIDYDLRAMLVFESLHLDDYKCRTEPISDPGGRSGSVALMPVYYRDPVNPSRIVIFEGGLGLRGSKLGGLSSTFMSATAANMAAHQVSFMLTHKFDAITILTRAQDFDANFSLSLRQLISNQIDNMYLLIIDLDDFKNVNTAHGLLGGNAVLRNTAETIKRSVRGDDEVSRYGGEEFVVVLRNVASADEASVIAERVRRSVERQITYFRDSEVRITCSIGVSRVDDMARKMMVSRSVLDDALLETIRTLAFESTNRGLDEAKSTGKNRVCFGRMTVIPPGPCYS
jgi:diguanylate cyclase (GGDEF)-like protein